MSCLCWRCSAAADTGYDKIVKDFNDRRDELRRKIVGLKNDLAEAKMQAEVIVGNVEGWLTTADTELALAQTLADEIYNRRSKWGRKNPLRRKLAEKTRDISILLKTLDISILLKTFNFPEVGCHPSEGAELTGGFMVSDSSQLALDGIMKALSGDGVNMIGLWGMPGVGKTTLAKEVGRQAFGELKLFDKVVIVTVSKTPNINKIQARIAEDLGCPFEFDDTNTEEGRATELRKILKCEKKILIVVDDVWGNFELKTIGIPVGSEHDGCKILLTTRHQEVCTRMNCQEEIELSIFTEEEAWALFKVKAGLDYASPKIIDVAKEVVQECKALPLAIVIVGNTLKTCESPDEWRAALQRLKASKHLDHKEIYSCLDEMLFSIYSCLELSYDHLKEENIQLCLLLCSLFPEDDDIDVEDQLIVCGIGQGLFSKIDSFEDRRREIRVALTKLQKSGLLMESDRGERFVRMHDVVRDFALWISSRGENNFVVTNGITDLLPMTESFKPYTAMALWNTNIENLSDKLEFSKLTILLLRRERENLLSIPRMLFETMNALRVLFLENVIFSMDALQFLPDLRTLRLCRCKLIKNISSLGHEKKLEILQLYDTIDELPEELVELCTSLESLHFHYFNKECKFSPNLVSSINRLSSLQELHVRSKNNANILELKSVLSGLTALTLPIHTSVECLEESFVFPKLQRYSISVNDYHDNVPDGSYLRRLEIRNFSYSLRAFKELFCNIDELVLNDVEKLTSLDDLECLVDTTPTPTGFLPDLKELRIQSCRRLQWVYQLKEKRHDKTLLIIFPELLTRLELYSLPELQSIWKELVVSKDAAISSCLRSLKFVRIEDCHKLKFIFTGCLAYSLLHLQELKISQCDGLRQVFDFFKEMKSSLEENQAAPALSKLTSLELSILPELECIWRPTYGVNLKCLRTMRIQECDKLSYLFWPSLAQTLEHLEELKIEKCEFLEHLIKEEENGDEIVSNMQQGLPLCWPKLKTLEISGCKILKYAFPITLGQGLPHLESVEISDCPQLWQVFNMVKEREEVDIVLSQLRVLKIKSCPLFRSPIKQGVVPLHLHMEGEQLSLSNAKNLTLERTYDRDFVPYLDAKGPNELNLLNLKNWKGLEFLVDTTNEGGNVSAAAFLNLAELELHYMPDLRMLCKGQNPKQFLKKLEKLKISYCGNMTSLLISPEGIDSGHYISLQKLRVVEISNCYRLRYLFSPSIARSMELLEQLKISNCKALEHIIAVAEFENDGHLGKQVLDVAEGKNRIDSAIAFPHLQVLQLENLSNLSRFCSENYMLMLPSLETLRVSGSPRLIDLTIHKEVNEEAQLKPNNDQIKSLSSKDGQQHHSSSSSIIRRDDEVATLSSDEDEQQYQPPSFLSEDEQQQPSFLSINPEDGERTALSSNIEDNINTLSSKDGQQPSFSSSTMHEDEVADDQKKTSSSEDENEQLSSTLSLNVSDIGEEELRELPSNLHSLGIERYTSKSIPAGILESISLQHLSIIDSISLKIFPLSSLLKTLYIRSCNNLNPPQSDQMRNLKDAHLENLCLASCHSLDSFPLNCFRKLEALDIWDCKNLRRLSIEMECQKNLTSLEALEIKDCPEFTSFAEEGEFQAPNLTSLVFFNCKSLKSLQPLQCLKSLRSLNISKCPSMESLPAEGLPSSLIILCISFCDKLTPHKAWKLAELHSLSHFEIEGGCQNLKSFPEEGLLPNNLNSLRVSRLPNLKSLQAKELQKLSSLKTLDINGCNELNSLPEDGLPSSLSSLTIRNCSLLNPKLQKRRGREWIKISRIPSIHLDDEVSD